MSTKAAALRAEPHATVGTAILRDAGRIIDKWARRAAEEQPSAKRAHHAVLIDHLPTFLWELGRSLATAAPDGHRHTRPADTHGDQRWEHGWSIEEVIRDYQLLRVVVTEHLDEAIPAPLTPREVMALGVFIDDAISASVSAYLAGQARAAAAAPPPPPPDAPPGDLLAVLGVLGHELRNPLAPLGNALRILALAAHDPAAVERARAVMERQFGVMTRLVDDLLDLPRLRRGKMQLSPDRVDLARLVRDAVEDRRGAFDAAGVALKFDGPDRPAGTAGDPARLAQVVGNLLTNALKFTDRGGAVRVAVTADPGRQTVRVVVADTGIGIDPSLLTRVFEPFVQADRSFERSRGGLGLGLALVKGIVELHGGTVRAFSDGPGAGTEVGFELPLIDLPAGESEPAATVEPAARGRRVLVIEDNADSAESLKMLLELGGHRVAVAHSGEAGVRAAAATPPDVVVCDIGLPGMSGHAVCAELRKLPGMAAARYVALTGHAPDPDANPPAAGGFDLYLLKPVDPDRLARVIAGEK